MILIHRITPFVLTLLNTILFLAFLMQWLSVPVVFILFNIINIVVLSRLIGWSISTFQYWFLLGVPLVFLNTTYVFLLFSEEAVVSYIIALFALALSFLFFENVFHFLHLPSSYQPYSLEYLSIMISMGSMFFLSAAGFGMRLLLLSPVWILALIIFTIAFFFFYGTLWVSKLPESNVLKVSLVGAVLQAEFFIAFTYLPSGYFTNAALITIVFYLTLGMFRALLEKKLSKKVFRRYVSTGAVLSLLVIVSSRWL